MNLLLMPATASLASITPRVHTEAGAHVLTSSLCVVGTTTHANWKHVHHVMTAQLILRLLRAIVQILVLKVDIVFFFLYSHFLNIP